MPLDNSGSSTDRQERLPPHVAVGNCKACGHRIQALRMTILGRDATPNVNPETCIYCPKETTNG
jgi:hypothetical protein